MAMSSRSRSRSRSRGAGAGAHVTGALVLACAAAVRVAAHPHHHDGPADDTVPIDSILWIHMLLQAFTWIVLFPLTMVLGLVRHRFHVPLSAASLLLTTGGYFLGHGHGGRSFPHTAHGTFASLMVFYLAAQTALGIYLKLHLRWAAERYVRPPLLLVHGILGRLFPLVGWVQCLFGIFTLRSWCFGGHLGQCVAHHIMGSAFQAYAVIMLIMMKAAAGWLKRRGQSQEWFDSWVIFAWGWVSALTEHHSGPWTNKDLQHAMMCASWIAGGALGIWLSRGGRRSVVPGLMIVLTGWAMSGHAQKLAISTTMYSLFGYVLMAAGVARIIEVCFVLQDGPSGYVPSAPARRASRNIPAEAEDADEEAELEAEADVLSSASSGVEEVRAERDPHTGAIRRERNGWFEVRAFQYLPPFLLTAGGVLFMSATDEQLQWADKQGVDAVTWGMIDFAISLALFFWFNVLIGLYVSWGGYKGLAGGKQSAVSASGRVERGAAARAGRGSDYVPMSRRSESISVTASLLSGDDARKSVGLEGARANQQGGTDTKANAKPLRGILANGGAGHDDEKAAASAAGSGSAAGTGGHHVLFADSDREEDDEDADPFDDELGDDDNHEDDDDGRRRWRRSRAR